MLPNANEQITTSQECFGIYPTDIIIRTAILEGLRLLREQPFLLDIAFQSLLMDPVTVRHYGAEELLRSKEWILQSEIVVAMAYNLNQATIPHVTIYLGAQQEAEATLGDIHYTTSEPLNVQMLAAKNTIISFTPVAYSAASGIGTITLNSVQNTSEIWSGMRVLDVSNSRTYTILEVPDAQRFTIDVGTFVPNLTNAQIVRSSDLLIAKLESVFYKETLHLELTTEGDATRLLVLHYVILFILHRYKQSLLEARGFERSIVSVSDMQQLKFGSNAAQRWHNRVITLTGFVKQYWVKEIEPVLEGTKTELEMLSNRDEPDSLAGLVGLQGWSTVQE